MCVCVCVSPRIIDDSLGRSVLHQKILAKAHTSRRGYCCVLCCTYNNMSSGERAAVGLVPSSMIDIEGPTSCAGLGHTSVKGREDGATANDWTVSREAQEAGGLVSAVDQLQIAQLGHLLLS